MFGYLIPRNYMEAMQFDSENKNIKWYDAIKLEMESMLEYKVFKKWDKAILDKHKKVTNPPKGCHRIKVHLVFAVKFDGRHKARLVADGHLTPEPIENIYSGVVSLRNLRLVIFLGKLNNLELWGADIGNAYLEAFTDEKLYIVAGPKFQELEGYILIFLKALYGLKSSGKRWAEVLLSILRDITVLPSKADPSIWLRKAANLKCYEYIAVYVDDLCINVQMKKIILSRDVQWLNSFWKQYKTRNNDSRNLVEEFFPNDEDDQNLEESDTEENKVSGDGNNTMEQKKLGIDIDMIGARKEELGRTRSQTKEMMSPKNESMERAEFTMEDWIHETCLISAVASGPTEPKTFQEAWHSAVEEEKENWQIAIRKEIRSMINRGVWRKIDREKIPENRRLIGNKWVFKIKRDGTYRARLVALGYSQIPGIDYRQLCTSST